MDLLNLKSRAKEGFAKYKAVIIVILAGILLMNLPQLPKEPEPQPVIQQVPAENLEEELEALLSCIAGAGKVKLLLSPGAGEETLYEQDEDRSQTGLQRKTVLITDRDRQQLGLIRQVNPQRYRGAVVLAQGADHPAVRLAIVEAVASAAGLTSDKITVLKMK